MIDKKIKKSRLLFYTLFALIYSIGCENRFLDKPEIDEEEIEVVLNPASSISWGSVTLTGNVVLQKGSFRMIQMGVEYWEEGKEHQSKDFGRRELTDSFSFELNGLAPETTYHCRLLVNRFFSNEISFKTDAYIIPVNSVSLNESELSLYEGESFDLIATVSPENESTQSIEWVSSDTSVASVKGGKVLANREGVAFITAKVGEIAAECKVTVIRRNNAQPKNTIIYTSSDGLIVNPFSNSSDVFGASIVSNDYSNGLGTIIFDSDVTCIGKEAFRNCLNLTSISLPEGVTIIGGSAFSGCTALRGIVIPESVLEVEPAAFYYCQSLSSFGGKFASPDGEFLIVNGILVAVALGLSAEEITIPIEVTSIGEWAVANYSSLKTANLPKSISRIGEWAFNGCVELTSINIPEGITSIESHTFNGCRSLTQIHIPDGVEIIGESAFQSCRGLVSISIPETVISIGNHAFYRCSALTSVNLPKTLAGIEESVFSGCTSLNNVVIPNATWYIGPGAFSGCSSLTSMTIPEKVVFIDYGAFSSCSGLNELIVLPDQVPVGRPKMLDNTNNCPIFVPAVSVEAYKEAPYWSDYADRIQAIPE